MKIPAPAGLLSLGLTTLIFCHPAEKQDQRIDRPNVLIVMADQWRAQAFGFAGNTDVKTSHIDTLASQSIVFTKSRS